MSKLPLCNMQGESVGEVKLADGLLELKKGTQAVHDVVEAHRARRRAGTASTKKRGEVSGGGAKPWRQKGTGRARAGSIRSPIWKGGGTIFGPHPRSYEKKVTKKAARLAFRRAFSEKVAAGDVLVVDQMTVAAPKTKHVAEMLKKLKLEKGALLVLDGVERNFALASRNIPGIEVAAARDVHTYQLLRYPKVVVSKGAMPLLEARLKSSGGKKA